MSVFDNQPNNLNQLSPLGFKFQIKKTPHVNYFCDRANLPSLTLQDLEIPNPFQRYPVPGVQLTWDPLSITFKVDEDLKNWLEIHNWLIGMGFPDEFSQFRELWEDDPIGRRTKGYYSDCNLIILTNQNNPNIEITFRDAIPIALTELAFDATLSGVDYITADATFQYRKYDVTLLRE